MPTVLIGEPNEWAWGFYRVIEDFNYHLIKLNDLQFALEKLGLKLETIYELKDKMTEPPPIDYTT